MRYKYWIGIGASIILGLIFFAAGLGKLLHQLLQQPEAFKIFVTPLPGFLPLFFVKVVFIWLPRIELVVGLLLIIGIAVKLVATFSSVLIAGFIAINSLMIIQGLAHGRCPSCFGPQLALRAVDALFIDIIMVVLVLIILFCYQSNFFNIYPWFLKRGRIAEKKDWTGSG